MGDIFNQNVQRNKRCIGRQITKLSFLKHHYVNVLPHNNSFRLMLVVQHLVTGWWCLCNLCLLYVISVRGEDHSITYMFTATYRTCQNIVWVLSRLLSVVVSRPFGPISKSPLLQPSTYREETSRQGVKGQSRRERERESVQTVMLIRCYYPPLPADSLWTALVLLTASRRCPTCSRYWGFLMHSLTVFAPPDLPRQHRLCSGTFGFTN